MGKRLLVLMLSGLVLAATWQAPTAAAQSGGGGGEVGGLDPGCTASAPVQSTDPNNPDVMTVPYPSQLFEYLGLVYVSVGSPVPDQQLFPYGSTPFYQNQAIVRVYTTSPGAQFEICQGNGATATPTPTAGFGGGPNPWDDCEPVAGVPYNTGGASSFLGASWPSGWGTTDIDYDGVSYSSRILLNENANGYWFRVLSSSRAVHLLAANGIYDGINGNGGFTISSNLDLSEDSWYRIADDTNLVTMYMSYFGGADNYTVIVCRPLPEPSPTATPTGTRSPTPTWTPQPNCTDYNSSGPANFITVNMSVAYYGQKTIRVSSTSTVFATVAGVSIGYWQNGDVRTAPVGTYYLNTSSSAPHSLRICTSLTTPTPSPTRTPTITGTPATATATATRTPSATPTAGVAGCVGQLYTVPGAPAQTTIALQRDQQFVIADTSVTVYLSVTLTLAPGFYRWNLPSDSYTMSGADGTDARLLLCVADQPPQLTGTLAPCSCAAVTAIAAPTARRGSLVDLSVPLPTLLPLTAAPITSTVTISATVVIRAIQTVQAGIRTPAAAIGTQTAGYSWESGAELSASWATPIAPALEWFSVINPQAPAWSTDGGPLWALAPLLLPILPIIGVGLVVVAIRFYIWVMAWILKLIDIIFKLIELIPGE